MSPVKRSTFSVLVGARQLLATPIRIVLPHQHVLSRPHLLITYPQQPITPITSSALPDHNVVQVTRGFQVIINSYLMSAIQRKTASFSLLRCSLPLEYPKTSPIYGNDRLALVRYCPLFPVSFGTEEDAPVSIVEKQTTEVFLGVVRAPGHDTSSEFSFTSKKLVSDPPELRCDAVSFISPLPSSFSAFVASILTDETMDLSVAPPIEDNALDSQRVSESCEVDMELALAISVPLPLCNSQITITFDDASTVRNKCDPQSNEMSKPASVDLTDAPDAPVDIELQQQDESITLVAPSPTDSPNTSQEHPSPTFKIMPDNADVVEAVEPVELDLAQDASLLLCVAIDTYMTLGIIACRTIPDLLSQWQEELTRAISLPCLMSDNLKYNLPVDETASFVRIDLLDTVDQGQDIPVTFRVFSPSPPAERQLRIATSVTAPNLPDTLERQSDLTHAPSLPVALCSLGDKSDKYDLPADEMDPENVSPAVDATHQQQDSFAALVAPSSTDSTDTDQPQQDEHLPSSTSQQPSASQVKMWANERTRARRSRRKFGQERKRKLQQAARELETDESDQHAPALPSPTVASPSAEIRYAGPQLRPAAAAIIPKQPQPAS